MQPSAAVALSHLIHFRCIRLEHLRMEEKDRIFVHGTGWAYCAAGRAAASHQFVPTGGVERRQLLRVVPTPGGR